MTAAATETPVKPAVPFNADRPGVIRRTRGLNGYDVCMYKDEPGVFLTKSGQPVSLKDAAKAGYDVKALQRAAVKIKLLAEASAKIEKQMKAFEAESEDAIDQALAKLEGGDEDPPLPGDPGDDPGEVVTTAGGDPRETPTRKMEHMGFGNWNVIDKATGTILAEGITKDAAETVLMEE